MAKPAPKLSDGLRGGLVRPQALERGARAGLVDCGQMRRVIYGHSAAFGSKVAFLGLASIAMLGLATVWLLMPETRPATRSPSRRRQAVMGPLP